MPYELHSVADSSDELVGTDCALHSPTAGWKWMREATTRFRTPGQRKLFLLLNEATSSSCWQSSLASQADFRMQGHIWPFLRALSSASKFSITKEFEVIQSFQVKGKQWKAKKKMFTNTQMCKSSTIQPINKKGTIIFIRF